MIQNDDRHESIDSLKDLVVGKMESLYEYTKKNIQYGVDLFNDGPELFDKVNTDIKDSIGDLKAKDVKKLALCLNALSDVVVQMEQAGEQEKYDEMLKGGHLIIKDGGKLYEQLKQESKDQGVFRKRISSHHKGRDPSKHDIGIDTETFGELLIGVTKEGDTYMQFEGAAVTDLLSFIKHMLDYFKYIITGRNQGLLGDSMHTEHHNPIIVDPQKALLESPILPEGGSVEWPLDLALSATQEKVQSSTRENEEGRDLEQFITIMPKSLKLDIDPDKGSHM